MKDALMQYETIDAEQVDDLMASRKVRPPKDWHDDDFNSHLRSREGSSSEPETKDDKKPGPIGDRKSTRLNSSHVAISYAVFCSKKKQRRTQPRALQRSRIQAWGLQS